MRATPFAKRFCYAIKMKIVENVNCIFMLNNNNICRLQAKFLNLCKSYIYTRQSEREYEKQEVDLQYTWSVEYLINSDDKKQPVQK